MTDKAAIRDARRPSGKPRGTRDPELNLDARAQAFLDRIARGTSFEPYPISVLADPKKIIGALD
jgi:hypothetical protein